MPEPGDPATGGEDEPAPARSGGWRGLFNGHASPDSHHFVLTRRVLAGVWEDGFIHAGNLAYMAILSLFPFFIVMAAIFSAVGKGAERDASVHAFLTALPPVVSRALEPVARDVIAARHGWLLWAGGAVGLWTVSSLIETIRDILRRAYGTNANPAVWWRYRLLSGGLIVLAVVGVLASLYLQVGIATVRELVAARFHGFGHLARHLGFSRVIPPAVLFVSIYLLFRSLTPAPYRRIRSPVWPGALLVTLWWSLVSEALPFLLRVLFKYDLTYGSLAGVMISLFFFWLVGLGMVTGAELNAALAHDPAPRDDLGQADNRARQDTAKDDTN